MEDISLLQLEAAIDEASRVFVVIHDTQDRPVTRVQVTKEALREALDQTPETTSYHIKWFGNAGSDGSDCLLVR